MEQNKQEEHKSNQMEQNTQEKHKSNQMEQETQGIEQKPNSTAEDLQKLKEQTKFTDEQFQHYHDMFAQMTCCSPDQQGATVANFVEQFTALGSEASPSRRSRCATRTEIKPWTSRSSSWPWTWR